MRDEILRLIDLHTELSEKLERDAEALLLQVQELRRLAGIIKQKTLEWLGEPS